MPKLEREQSEWEKIVFDLLDKVSPESAKSIIEDIERQGIKLDFDNKRARGIE